MGNQLNYRKIPKISPGAYIFQRPFLRGLSTEGYLRFKIDWASLIVGRKFTVFALFYFVFEGNFPSTSPQGAYIRRGDLTEGFLRYRFGGLIFGGAYFRNFTVYHFCQVQIEVSEKAIFSDLSFHTNLMMSSSVNAVKF